MQIQSQYAWGGAWESTFISDKPPGGAGAAVLGALSSKLEMKPEVQPQTYWIHICILVSSILLKGILYSRKKKAY